MPDPFTEVYDTVWAALEASSEVTSRVALRNRIKFASATETLSRDPRKPGYQHGDFPLLALEPAGDEIDLCSDSTSCRLMQQLRLTLMSGDLRASAQLYPLKWAIIKALIDKGPTLGLSYVTDVRVLSVDDQQQELEDDVGPAQWTTVAVIQVRMEFDRRSLP